MVNELGVRLVQHLQPFALRPQAVVDVVEIDPERVVEPTQGLKDATSGGQARPRDGGHFPGRRGHVEIACFPNAQPRKDVIGRATHADDDATMLQSPVGIEQASTDRTDLGTHGLRRHSVDPTGLVCLNVIVEKEKDVTGRDSGRGVVEL